MPAACSRIPLKKRAGEGMGGWGKGNPSRASRGVTFPQTTYDSVNMP